MHFLIIIIIIILLCIVKVLAIKFGGLSCHFVKKIKLKRG
jgi:hypothetical protein